MNGQVERTNGLILQGMKTRRFHDLEARGRNWLKELPSVLWALRTNVVYGADVVLPPEIYFQLARVAHFDSEYQAKA
jgi:hypothetical protein